MPLRDLRPQRTRRSPEELLRHLRSFELVPRFSVGVWHFSPMASRFHEPYGPAVDLPARLERVAALRDYGVEAVEAHYPNEISEATLDLWRQFTRDAGIRLLTIVPGLFADREFEFGSLSSPLPEARERHRPGAATPARTILGDLRLSPLGRRWVPCRRLPRRSDGRGPRRSWSAAVHPGPA